MTKIFKINLLIVLIIVLSGCSKQQKLTLIKKGETEYSIYMNPAASESVKKAAADLRNYFIKITGISPEIIVSAKPPGGPLISLGSNYAAKNAGLDASDIPNDGFRIVTRNGNLFILGPDTPTGEVNKLGGVTNGTSNGIYTFIEDYLGVTWLMPGELGEEYEKSKSISIPAIDRTESSPFNYRSQSFRSRGPLEDEWDRKIKLGKVSAVSHSHVWAQTIPASLYEKHPDWFAQVEGKHLPPSGRYKLETTNPGLVQAFADTIMARFRRNPNLRWHSLSPADGSYGWSDSPASMALIEKDPFGNLSRTPLILKFYNDVARIVGKEFPDHKLGGYIYSMYLYPPKAGLPKIEPNLALVVATSISYGFQLYRPSTQENWDNLMKTWGESAKKDGFDLYYYDLPTSIMQPNGILWPPSPDILNFIFTRLRNYGFKGAYIYGNPVWPVFGGGTYTIAKMQWYPDQDAYDILKNYYEKTFGNKTAPFIWKIYNTLDTAYNTFMNAHPRANYSLSMDHLKEIYSPNFREIENYYLQAQDLKRNPKQQKRYELFGQVLSLMQWNLRNLGLVSPDYRSALTLTDEEIDKILTNQADDGRITRAGGVRPEDPFKVEQMPVLPGVEQKAALVPLNGSMKMLLYVPIDTEVSININNFDGRAEFIQYTLTDAEGKQLKVGAIREGRKINFTGKAGKSYILEIPSRGAVLKLDVQNAAIAYKSNLQDDAIQFAAGKYMDGPLTLYFYVPEGINGFNVTLGTKGANADLFSPKGLSMGRMDCSETTVSRIDISNNNSKPGFWKIIIQKFEGSTISLTLDEKLPQWLIPDPAKPMKILAER